MKLPEFKKKQKIAAAAAVIFIVAAGAGVYIVSAATKNDSKEQEAMYQTVSLGKQDVTKEIGLSGTLDSAHSESVSSTLEGVKVKEICIQVGDQVNAGDVLFRLDSTDIENKLKAAKNSLTSEKEKNAADVRSSQRNYADAQTTQNVEAGRSTQNVTDATNNYNAAVEAKISADSEYQKAVSGRKDKEKEWKKAKEELSTAKDKEKTKKTELDKAKASEDENIIASASQEYDNAAAARQACEAKATSAESNVAALKEAEVAKEAGAKEAGEGVKNSQDAINKSGQEKEDATRGNQKSVEDQKDSLDAAKRSASDESSAAQEVENYEKALEECTVKAASSGVVTSINVKVGDTYNNGVMATVQDEKNYIVTAMVGQYDISDINKDMAAIIETETTGEEKMEGTVTFVSPVPGTVASGEGDKNASAGGNNYEVRITVKNPSERLRIGMTAKVKLIQDKVKGVFAVPGDCVQYRDDESCFIQVLKDNIPKEITVEKGLETDYYTEISSKELTEGMEIIIPEVTGAPSETGGGSVSIY